MHYKMKVKQQHLPAMSALLWAATNAHALKISNFFNGIIVDEIMTSRHLEDASDTEETERRLNTPHVGDAVIVTVSAWLVFVVVSVYILDYCSLYDDI